MMYRTLFILLAVILCGCSSQTFSPVSSANPWLDDYSSISQMKNYSDWGAYNVHDPSCRKVGDTYYMYSTDAIFRESREDALKDNVPLGYIQMRKSTDLVNWTMIGWALAEIPAQAVEWVKSNSNGEGATNIWAPYMVQHGHKFRLYYCVSSFASQNSYIGMLESDSPDGEWTQVGCVLKTSVGDAMNAIDPSIVTDQQGRVLMHYGSYFGGLYCVELDAQSGMTKISGDKGHLVASRANRVRDNIEAPEIIYNPELKKYFLFVSYDPLMTTYNIRVGRSDSADGPFLDYFGNDMKDTTNNYPILTYPYRFEGHGGWAGTAHCGVVDDGQGNFFLMHQGRLSPGNHMMVLNVREVKWSVDGWPVLSPERYAATKPIRVKRDMLAGEWEIVRLRESDYPRGLFAGQILWGEGELHKKEVNVSTRLTINPNGTLSTEKESGKWSYDNYLNMQFGGEQIDNIIVFAGQDWERQMSTLLFTGIDKSGCSVWGKKIR